MSEVAEGQSPSSFKKLDAVKEGFRTYKSLEANLTEVKKAPVPQEVIDAYEENKDVIESIYGTSNPTRLLHHGTGYTQYKGDKYGEGTSQELRHPLDDIITKGLQPHRDTWIISQDEIDSTSFAITWPYAKWYADKHQDPQDPLLWEYGDSSQWFPFFMADSVLDEIKKGLIHPIAAAKYLPKFTQRAKRMISSVRRNKPSSPPQLSKVQKWVSDVRSNITPETSLSDVLSGRTDIAGNFGGIITVSENDVPLTPMGPGGSYEKRTVVPITPDKFLSLAVPINKVEEYRQVVVEAGFTFPVLPLEAVDYHMSNFSFEQLTKLQKAS